MDKPRVVIIGGAYVDIAVRCREVPAAGQTVAGSSVSCRITGSGVNQATQASLCGCEVHLIAKVGQDHLAQTILENLNKYDINTDHIFSSPAQQTGAVITMVNALGENAMCVSSGANKQLKASDIESTEDLIASAKVCLIHGEIPPEAAIAAIRLANLHKVKLLLDPAFCVNGNTRRLGELPMDYFSVNILLPNIQEAAELADEPITDVHKAKLVGSDLVARGAENVVIKMGRRGSLIVNRQGVEHILPFEVEMVDKTCAGDAFAGALAAYCALDSDIAQAVRFAAAAGSLACTKFGCQDSLPKKEDILELLHLSEI